MTRRHALTVLQSADALGGGWAVREQAAFVRTLLDEMARYERISDTRTAAIDEQLDDEVTRLEELLAPSVRSGTTLAQLSEERGAA
jgi:hypothetical protein